MTDKNFLTDLKFLRAAIRYHRDQKGDDRCWIDDNKLWALLPDSPPDLVGLPSFDEMMKRCSDFFQYRRAEAPDPVPADAALDASTWDSDCEAMSTTELQHELQRTQDAIRTHRDVAGRERTLEDDRKLYLVLPEQLAADFRLPSKEDFLGETRAPHAGCPSFWRSHQQCSCHEHDVHRWGPCSC
jgi:hypothetical protein